MLEMTTHGHLYQSEKAASCFSWLLMPQQGVSGAARTIPVKTNDVTQTTQVILWEGKRSLVDDLMFA